MDSERFRRAKGLFARVCDLAPDAQAELLARECGDDAELRAQVESLLRADTDSLDVIDTPAAERLPESVGGYRILRLLGQGGMGTVYEAKQENPNRRVALKVLAPFVVGDDATRRFRYETEILGQLDHPGIARIYDAGVDAGRPWFAMELVEGEPLDRFTSRPLAERLLLFRDICHAAQHAHNRGVVHRDLKPANILVDRRGQPKLLDFGVAKIVDGEDRTLATRAGQIVGTVAYMAPEQVSAGSGTIDPRTDVYTLGVIGYELLTGRRPLELAGKSLTQALAAVRDVDAPRLGHLDTRWRGDIETIFAKALEKEPSRRYESAAALAADIQRHVDHEPIIARPPTTAYRLKKFVRRNRAVVASLAVVFSALVAATAVSTSYFLEAESERNRFLKERDEARRQKDRADTEADRANREAQRANEKAQLAREKQAFADRRARTANAAMDFIVDIFRLENPFSKGDVSTRDVLRNASKRVREDLENQPEMQAELGLSIGRIWEQIGDNDRAAAMYRVSLDAARSIGRDRTLIRALEGLGGALTAERRFREAKPVLQEFLKRARAGDSAPGGLTVALVRMASYHHGSNELAEAERLLREAITGKEEFPQRAEIIANARKRLAMILRRKGRFDEALKVIGQDSGKIPFGPRHMDLLEVKADILMSLRRNKEALAVLREIEKDYLPRFDGNDFSAIKVRHRLAVALAGVKRYKEAIPLLDDCVTRAGKALGKHHPNTLAILAKYVEIRVKARQLDGLETVARDLVDRQRKRTGPGAKFRLGGYAVVLGNVLAGLGRPGEAIPHYEEALTIARKSPGIASAPGANTLLYLNRARVAAGQFKEALGSAKESLAVQRRVYGDDSLNYTLAVHHLGVVLYEAGPRGLATRMLQRCAPLLRKHGPTSAELLKTLELLGTIAEAKGDRKTALACARERLGILEKAYGSDPRVQAARARVAALGGR